MTKLIVNADDFGYSEAVNYGIISAHKKGIVTSCTVMANMPGFEHAMELLKENPTLGCGVHMTLSCYRPLLDGHKTIVDENGNYFRRPTDEVLSKMDLEEVYNEFCAQIDRVKQYTEITHIDSHHHVHATEILKPVVQRIMDKYKVPMRQASDVKIDGVNSVDVLTSFYGENVEEDYFEKNIDLIRTYEVVDLMCHPAFIDNFLLGSTSYAIPRAKEHSILIDKDIKTFLGENGIELVNYSAIK